MCFKTTSRNNDWMSVGDDTPSPFLLGRLGCSFSLWFDWLSMNPNFCKFFFFVIYKRLKVWKVKRSIVHSLVFCFGMPSKILCSFPTAMLLVTLNAVTYDHCELASILQLIRAEPSGRTRSINNGCLFKIDVCQSWKICSFKNEES